MSHVYPEVSRIAVDDGEIVILLGEYFLSESARDIVLRRSSAGEWATVQADDLSVLPLPAETCDAEMDPPLDVPWLNMWTQYADFPADFNQYLGACTSDGQATWAGTAFYSGEGSWGVGALIRKDPETGEYRYVHDGHLQPYSTNYIEHFASQLWLGTTHHGECFGPAYGYGVMRYDLRNEITIRPVPEICGFAVRGMIKHEDKLWVATDLGLAVGTSLESGQVGWQNFLPDFDDESLMRPVECHDLYEELLRSTRMAAATAFDMGYAFEDFWGRLSSLRREFVRDYLRKLHNHPDYAHPEY